MYIRTNALLSSGVGRIHFVEIAIALHKRQYPFNLICGYVPSSRLSGLLRLVGPILARPNLDKRLDVRLGPDGILKRYLLSNAAAEGLAQFFLRLANLRCVPRNITQAWSWRFFGYMSRRYIHNQAIFHVRSGAGGGGAIAKAKSLGLKVLVDHSIAHPSFVSKWTAPEYDRYGDRALGLMQGAFWDLVIKDCLEADAILVNSDFVKSTFVAEGYDSGKIHVLYLGVREDFFGIKKSYKMGKKLRLLFTGSFDLRKGARILVEAMELLQKRGVDFELHVAGGNLEADLYFKDRLSVLPVIFYGALLQDDIKRLLSDSDIYVFPTFAEGCAKSAMEALVAGLPVITTSACGLPPIARDCYVEIPAGDSQRLCEEIIKLADDEGLRQTMGQGGVELASNFTWDKFGGRLINLYQNL